MLCVGFLEETIFRGLPFTAIAKDNIKSAVIISSVTFGIGHIINLFNGSGMDLVNNLCRIVFAVAVPAGHVFYRGGSLLPCILVQSAINTFGIFANDTNLTTKNATAPSHCFDRNYGCLHIDTCKNTPEKRIRTDQKKMKGNKNHEKYTV